MLVVSVRQCCVSGQCEAVLCQWSVRGSVVLVVSVRQCCVSGQCEAVLCQWSV